jgi:hypothetical protein
MSWDARDDTPRSIIKIILAQKGLDDLKDILNLLYKYNIFIIIDSLAILPEYFTYTQCIFSGCEK